MTADGMFGRAARSPSALAVGGALLLVLGIAVGTAADGSDAVFRSGYLAIYFWLGIALGALLLLMLHALTGGRWGEHGRPWMLAAASTLPLLAVLFVGLWAGIDSLFPWAGGSRPDADFHANQQRWLQPGWQRVRSAIYFAVWIGAAAAMGVWGGRRRGSTSRVAAASIGLIASVVAITMFSIDWVLALDMQANSSMIGFTQVSGQAAGALALVCACAALASGAAPDPVERRRARQDLGNLLLAAILFHAYTFYMDFLIVWQGNLPHEIAWWLLRADGPGAVSGVGLLVFQIVIPFVLLLSRAVKRSTHGLALAAGCVLLGRLCHAVWDLAPIYVSAAGSALLLDAVVVLAIGLLWFAAFAWFRQRRPDEQGEKA